MTNFIYKYGILSTIGAIWAMALTSYATFQMFWDIAAITVSAVSAYTALLGLPAIGFALYKWRNTGVDDDTK